MTGNPQPGYIEAKNLINVAKGVSQASRVRMMSRLWVFVWEAPVCILTEKTQVSSSTVLSSLDGSRSCYERPLALIPAPPASSLGITSHDRRITSRPQPSYRLFKHLRRITLDGIERLIEPR